MMRLVEVEAKPQASMASSLQIGSQSTTPPTEKSVPTVPAEKSGGAASTGRANASVGDVPLYDIGNELAIDACGFASTSTRRIMTRSPSSKIFPRNVGRG